MEIIADLHIHGKYSRACSSDLSIQKLEEFAKIKGLSLLGTGDFTHPKWLEHLKQNLAEEDGILKSKNGFNFVLQTEISLIYSQENKGQRIHLVVLSPDFATVDQIREELLKHGRLDYDGRPIFNIPAPEFVEEMRHISKDIEVIPAHIMTPHFSLFGAYNQFSNIKECFQEQTKHIHALETGLSADPQMLSRMSQLDRYLFISSSDSHSFWPWRIGRESTLFDINLNYSSLLKALRTKKGFKSTIEVDPNYGKYHYDGHRNCNISFSPKESLKNSNTCPVCKKELTIGVMHRIEELADRPKSHKSSQDFLKLIPLSELISYSINKGISTKSVWQVYNKLIHNFGTELDILLNAQKQDLDKVVSEKLSNLIINNRLQKIKVEPGYDGVYGRIKENKDLSDF